MTDAPAAGTPGAPRPDEPAPDAPRPAGAGPDALDALRAELAEEVDRLPVRDRLARFERANEVLARELAALDEI